MPAGGEIIIRSKTTKENLELYFTDTGKGIPEEIIDKIWKPLFTTKAKGMGFGLSICKRVVESHGGTISVKSKIGEGTTFIITLPLVR
jgi:signal transduction histidine kinase